MGQVITKSTPLPPFPDTLTESLKKGIYNTMAINQFFKKHIKFVTGDEYPTKSEYKILADQFETRLTELGIKNANRLRVSMEQTTSLMIKVVFFEID